MSHCKLILLLCASYCVAPHSCSASTAGTCQFLYTEQPPDELTCNPYIDGELRLECTVEVPLNSNESAVDWFYSESPTTLPSGCNGTQLSTNQTARISVLTMPDNLVNGMRFIRTQLRVFELNDIHVGVYWCKVRAEGVTGLLPSDSLYLQPSATYGHLEPCPTNQALSKEENKCAQPSLVFDSSTASTALMMTSASSVLSQVNPSQTTVYVGTLTTMAIQSPSSIAEPGSIPRSIPPLQPSVPPTNQGPSTDSTASTDSSFDEKLFLKLYIAIGILGAFIVFILVLLIVSIGLYLRKYYWKRGTNGRPISTQSSVCESPPSDLARSTSTNDYFCSRCSSRATTTDCDSGCSSQPPSRRSTLPVPSLPLTLARSAVPRGPEASMDHSYETALTISHDHDYEDISDLEDSGEYVVFPPVSMKRNPSYSAFRIQPRRGAGGGLAGLVPEPIIMQNLSVCTDELCAHDYLEPVSSTNICTGSP